MSTQILVVIGLTFIIHLITTLAYSVRLVGVRTGRIAISFSLFNVLVLLSRTANSFQAPLLAKHIEANILRGGMVSLESDFRWLLLTASLATLTGGFLVPTFQRALSKAVFAFSLYRSLPRLLLHSFSKAGIRHLKTAVAIPAPQRFVHSNLVSNIRQVPLYLILFNIIAESIMTVGVLAALYAGYLNPELRVTASNLSAVVNGGAVILLVLFIDPYLSMLTDDVIHGEISPMFFRRCVILLIISRLIGTILAQFLLLPAAQLIAVVAEFL